jgi:hypothetical protein
MLPSSRHDIKTLKSCKVSSSRTSQVIVVYCVRDIQVYVPVTPLSDLRYETL